MRIERDIIVRAFAPADQDDARALILEGFRERFGTIDEALNPDLRDIATSYANSRFLVAESGARIIGTGAMTTECEGVGRVQRMSTASDHRRRGIATSVLRELVERARGEQVRTVILDTNADWHDAIACYLRFGFAIVSHERGGVQFALDL